MSERKLFGTDGIRGKANVYPMTCEVAMALGRAVTYYFQKHSPNKDRRPKIIVGKDTRRSCYMLELAFSSGVCSQGGRVVLTGPLPTPGVAFVTHSMRADAGVMISASHNIFSDNGIKIFDRNGDKLADEVELELEELVLNPEKIETKIGPDLGNAKRLDEVFGRYIVYAKSAFNEDENLEGLDIVLDCANGAGYKIGPMVFDELGASVHALGVSPDGTNINDSCGALHPSDAMKLVKEKNAHIGICLDGDADRVVIIDENGEQVDGDRLIGLFAKFLLDTGVLKQGDEVVGTVMSNLGLENYIKELGLSFYRSKVGDRYILERLKKSNARLGGEPSGHIIFKDNASTGDGILSGLKTIEAMKYYDSPISKLTSSIDLYPQQLENIRVKQKTPIKKLPKLSEAIDSVNSELGHEGRVLIRYSGTESLMRIMVEGKDDQKVSSALKKLVETAKSEIGV